MADIPAEAREEGARLVSDDEMRQIALMTCYAAKLDGHEKGVPSPEIEALVAWAEGVRISEGLLANVLDGSMLIRLGADGQPTFELSPRGRAEVEAQLKEMGVTL